MIGFSKILFENWLDHGEGTEQKFDDHGPMSPHDMRPETNVDHDLNYDHDNMH